MRRARGLRRLMRGELALRDKPWAGLIAAGFIASSLIMAGSFGRAASAAAPVGPSLELGAAWAGIARPGRSTELRIVLPASAAPSREAVARLRIEAGPQLIETTLPLARDAPSQSAVPVPASESYRVEATLPDGSRVQREISLELTEEPLVAVSQGAAVGLPEQIARTPVDAAGFPHAAEAYAAVDAVAVDAATLAQLQPDQLAALLSYVERCGPTIAVGLPAAARALLRSAAGCDGRALHELPDPGALPVAIPAALAGAPAENVSAPDLRSLLASDAGVWPLVVAALAAWLAGSVLLLVFTQRARGVIACALAASLLAVLAGHLHPGKPRLAIWAESSGHGGRYAALAEMSGSGRGTRSLDLPALLEGPSPCDSATPSEARSVWHWDAAAHRYTSVIFEQRLFETVAVCWHGTFPLVRPARLDRLPDRMLSVTNCGDAPWPRAIAVVDDERYAVPALAAHATEMIAPAARDAADPSGLEAPAVELALLRAGGGAVLWPLELPALGFKTTSTRAFLLVHPAAKDAG